MKENPARDKLFELIGIPYEKIIFLSYKSDVTDFLYKEGEFEGFKKLVAEYLDEPNIVEIEETRLFYWLGLISMYGDQ